MPALGGLYAEAQCPDLDGAQLANRDLLQAVQQLGWFRDGAALSRVRYIDMGSEELGSVYESLLELVPEIDLHACRFGFVGLGAGSARGSARKLTGSYYTPDSLVQQLLRSALDPVIDARLAAQPDRPVEALLALTIVDPACGSGHFLLAAARRVAERVALLRTDGHPRVEDYRHALRDAISHCVYGVDRNPMAIELCKFALWLESLEPGRPLSFLDAHIRCGDALIGLHDLAVLRAGVPGDAFGALKDVLADRAIEGKWVDDPSACTALKKRNAAELKTPTLPLAGLAVSLPDDLDAALAMLGRTEDSLEDVRAKERLFEELRAEGTLAWRLFRASDLWTAAFFAVKRPVAQAGRELTPTSDTVWRFLADPGSLSTDVADEVKALREQYRFFHWPLEFPDVFKDGGFSLVLGNPPWETMSPDAKEFFSNYAPEIGRLSPAEQEARIEALLQGEPLRDAWERHARSLYAAVRFIKDSGRYRLFAEGNLGKGDFNVYRQFVETALRLTRQQGFASQIVPENFYNGANAAAIREELFSKFELQTLFGFENSRGVWFPGIDTRMKFALYAAKRGAPTVEFAAGFAVSSEERLQSTGQRPLHLLVTLVREFSPDALAVMEFSNQLEIDIARKIYARFPRLGDEVEGLPRWLPLREVDMGTDNKRFSTDPAGLPLYQGSMVTHHDYRAKGYVSGHGRNVVWEELPFGSDSKTIRPQWRIVPDQIPSKLSGRVQRYRIGFCDVGNATNQRSLMAALIPPNVVCGDKVPTIEFDPPDRTVMLLWLAVANSLAMDFIVRMKVALKMSMSLMATLPIPRKVEAGTATAQVAALAARLSCAGPEMQPFLASVRGLPVFAGLDLTPCEAPDERARLSAEIDAVVARDLYGLTRDEMRYLLEPKDVLGEDCMAETFAALRRADERQFREYRTRRLVLEAWDRLAAQEPR